MRFPYLSMHKRDEASESPRRIINSAPAAMVDASPTKKNTQFSPQGHGIPNASDAGAVRHASLLQLMTADLPYKKNTSPPPSNKSQHVELDDDWHTCVYMDH